ncbi:MAG TPA: hypothetical protein VMF64_04350 [Steroidobacteraceae bacterium]|nr:hypothetical protein [Steroidobacteraceae bacterium]
MGALILASARADVEAKFAARGSAAIPAVKQRRDIDPAIDVLRCEPVRIVHRWTHGRSSLFWAAVNVGFAPGIFKSEPR